MLVSQLGLILGVESSGDARPHWWPGGGAGGTVLGGVHPAGAVAAGVMVMVAASWAARWSPRTLASLMGVVLASRDGAYFRLAPSGRWAPCRGRMPPFVGFSWSPNDVLTVLPPGFALAFVGSVNILITSRVVEHFRGRHQAGAKWSGCGRGAGSLRYCECLCGNVRRAAQRRHSGT